MFPPPHIIKVPKIVDMDRIDVRMLDFTNYPKI